MYNVLDLLWHSGLDNVQMAVKESRYKADFIVNLKPQGTKINVHFKYMHIVWDRTVLFFFFFTHSNNLDAVGIGKRISLMLSLTTCKLPDLLQDLVILA